MLLTKEQRKALKKIYDRGDTTIPPETYLEFRRRAAFMAYDNCVLIRWCNMCLGLETDGHTHS